MIKLFIQLVIASSLIRLGISFANNRSCSSDKCVTNVNEAIVKTLNIDWKPIAVFPDHALRTSPPAR